MSSVKDKMREMLLEHPDSPARQELLKELDSYTEADCCEIYPHLMVLVMTNSGVFLI